MQILSGYSKFYELEPLKTEYTAAKLINQKFNDGNFQNVNATFVDFPWSVMINHNIRCVIPPVENGFVVCQHIDFAEMLDQWKEIGVKTLFTPHCIESSLRGIKVLPFPHKAYNYSYNSFRRKDLYDLSFVGATSTHWTRRYIMSLGADFWQKKGIRFFGMDTGKWHLEKSPEDQKRHSLLFRETMESSNFALCPRGTGPGTLRFWEALCFGCIPVVISDDWQLPETIYNWDDIIIRVEASADTMSNIPESIRAVTNIAERQQKCREIFMQFSQEGFITPILKWLSNNATS